MTENEALKYMKLFRDEWDRNSKTKNAEALDVAIKSLEEMQKIKALGDCYIIPKNSTWEANGIDIHKAITEIQQYRAIGTVDEVAEMSNSYINYFHKVRKYQAIGTIEELKALKEKNEPKKPTICKKEYDELLEMEYFQHYCDCGNRIYGVQQYCEMCGQAIDWQ